ncbi:hypothetical protein AVEN_185230-1 [Araneus ventricosus]|uniref:CCHC-type domain-containing protein n=1 Tax=Araneus ventricosus TaxID=182803 RepID=A0A4Y2P5V1_ARAVE|nr:hypothetical protein AVEN_185230-1 [Araneus ventricosus]
MRLSVRAYIPNPLRCFNCQRFGHSKLSCRGTLTCARCAKVGHDSTVCTAKEKCINCKGYHTSFSRDCSAWKQEKEIITTKITKQISYPEARKLVKSRTPTPGTSFASAIKKTPVAIFTPTNQSDLPSEINSKTSGPLPAAHLPVTTAGDILPQSVAPIGEAASASQDLSDFQIVNNSAKRNTDIKQTSKFWNTSPRQVSTSTALQNKTSDSRHDTNALTALNVGIDYNSVVQTAPESKGVLSSVRTQELHSRLRH